MASTVDFQSVMDQLTDFQNSLGKIHSNLTNVRNKDLLGEMLAKVQNARAEVEVEYPKAVNLINDTARESMAEAQQALAQIDQKRAEAQQKCAAVEAARKRVPKLPPVPEAKVDPALGQKLRLELLARFGPETGSDNTGPGKIREAWQDWD